MPTHAVVYWIHEDSHSVVKIADFFEIEEANDVAGDEIYNVYFSKKKGTKQFYSARCIWLGDKTTCKGQLLSIVTNQPRPSKIKHSSKIKSDTVMNAILNNKNNDSSQAVIESNPNLSFEFLLQENQLLKGKIGQLELVVDSKQDNLDKTNAELEVSKNKILSLMESLINIKLNGIINKY